MFMLFFLPPYLPLSIRSRLHYSSVFWLQPWYSENDLDDELSFTTIMYTMSSLLHIHIVWAAKTHSVPVQMVVSTFGNQKGIVIIIIHNDDDNYNGE